MDVILLWTIVCTIAGTVITVNAADCPGKADIIFAIPGGTNIPGEEFFPFEKFLVMLTDHFMIDEHNINIGLILYGREPIAVSYPQPLKNQSQNNARITLLSQRQNYIQKLYGRANVPGALRLMRVMFKNPTGYPLPNPRSGVKQIGVIFTYGAVPPDTVDDVTSAANDIKGDGVTMYVVGRTKIGPEFSSIGSDACKLFSMKSFIDGLPSVLPYLGSSLCSALDPNVNVTEENCFPQFWQPTPNPPVVCPRINAIFQDPYNCAYYYKCDLNVPVREACPASMLFDDIIKTCNYKESVACYSQVTCPDPVGLFPHPSDCSSFINCFDSIPYVQKCPDVLMYDKDTKQCVDKSVAKCRMF